MSDLKLKAHKINVAFPFTCTVNSECLSFFLGQFGKIVLGDQFSRLLTDVDSQKDPFLLPRLPSLLMTVY